MKTVLLVEDSGFFRRAMTVSLESRGIRVIAVGDGQEALMVAARVQPAVIILDMFLPKMNGMTVLRALRALPESQEIPVLILSASIDVNDVLIAKRLGFVEHVDKTTMDFEALVRKIREYLEIASDEHARAARSNVKAPITFVSTRPNRTLTLDPTGFATS